MEFIEVEKKVVPKRKNTSNKIGAKFEEELSEVFDDYFRSGDAYIKKIPVEATVIRKFGKIVNVVYKDKSDSLDYQGVLKDGRFITFEAKTYKAFEKNRKSALPFPLDNIADYQYELAEKLSDYTDKIFYIIQARFEDHNDTYIIHWKKIKKFKDESGRKSIPNEMLGQLGVKMETLDILDYIDQI